MKGKIIAILVMTLLITTALPSISGSVIKKANFIDTPSQDFVPRDFIFRIGENIADSNLEYEYITRDKIIEIAEAYTNYEWYPTADEYSSWRLPAMW